MHPRASSIFFIVACFIFTIAPPSSAHARASAPPPETRGAQDAALPAFDLRVEQELATPSLEPETDSSSSFRTVTTLGALQLGIQYTVLYFGEPPNWKAYGNSLEPSFTKLTSNFTVAPVWSPVAYGGGGTLGYLQADGDGWTTNVIGHGLQGSEIYLRMRREGFHWWQAFLGGVVHSTVWEYGIEGWNETPSAWDLGYTPVGGMVLGELRYQLVSWFDRRPSSWWTGGIRMVLDPVAQLASALD